LREEPGLGETHNYAQLRPIDARAARRRGPGNRCVAPSRRPSRQLHARQPDGWVWTRPCGLDGRSAAILSADGEESFFLPVSSPVASPTASPPAHAFFLVAHTIPRPRPDPTHSHKQLGEDLSDDESTTRGPPSMAPSSSAPPTPVGGAPSASVAAAVAAGHARPRTLRAGRAIGGSSTPPLPPEEADRLTHLPTTPPATEDLVEAAAVPDGALESADGRPSAEALAAHRAAGGHAFVGPVDREQVRASTRGVAGPGGNRRGAPSCPNAGRREG
jgi:hypothetical protein